MNPFNPTRKVDSTNRDIKLDNHSYLTGLILKGTLAIGFVMVILLVITFSYQKTVTC